MELRLVLLLLSAVARSAQYDTHFPGYGYNWYDPACTNACSSALAGAMLSCSPPMDHDMEGMEGMEMPMTTPDCYANDTAWLTTMAYCFDSRCDEEKVPTWKKQQYWADKVTTDPTVPPKWDYTTALSHVNGTPKAEFNSTSMEPLNGTMVVTDEDYNIQYDFNVLFDRIEKLQSKYLFVIVTIGVGSPILFALLGRLPLLSIIVAKIKPYLIFPSSVGSYHVRSLPMLLGNPPTMGQALWAAMFFILVLVLSAVNYGSSQPHPWGYSSKGEINAYVGYRTGHFSLGVLPIVILFSGRNNFLLWLTNWSHNTFLTLHRWVARIFALLVIVHSLALLVAFKDTGAYATDHSTPYWQWGIVATVLVSSMLVLSQLFFRKLAYEIFRLLHIISAIFVIVGTWYHIVLRFKYNFYENWLYAAIAVWFFDRLVRVLRVLKNGVRHAVITEVGADHVRVDIPGIRWANQPGYSAYAYFPLVHKLRPWENHPFSVNSTALFRSHHHTLSVGSGFGSPGRSSSPEHNGHGDIEKTQSKVGHQGVGHGRVDRTGLTLFIKKGAGMTKMLRSHRRMLTFVDGPYPHQPSSDVLRCDHILLIGGGIGITGLLGWIHAHPNVKLAWCVKKSAEALVTEMGTVLRDVADKEILVGDRLSIDAILRSAAKAGYGRVGVVVCGPPGMCDEVRSKVAALGRGGKTVFELEVDAFSW